MMVALTFVQECGFAKSYTLNDVRNEEIRKVYLENVIKQEAKFIRDVGVDKKTGLTVWFKQLELVTGDIYKRSSRPEEYYTASGESLHIAILARVLDDNNYA